MGLTEDQYKELDATLAGQQFIGGDVPTEEDKTTLESFGGEEPPMTLANLWAWYLTVVMFSDVVKSTWAAAKKGGKGKAPKKEEKKEEKKADDDDDDFDDMFGDDDGSAAEAAKNVKAAAEKKKKAKKVLVEKSIVVFEVKPWEAEQKIEDMAKAVMAIEMEGLFWKSEWKKEPIGFGINKLIIGCVVHDLKVGVDDLQEKIEALEDMVQSVDIQSFSKC